MANELDNLRPEVREAVAAIDKGNGVFVNGDDCEGGIAWATARAELLRLAEYEQAAGRLAIEKAELRQCAEQCEAELAAMPDADEWHALRERAERAEAELAESRETIKRLNRRVQVAEAGVAEKVKVSAPGSFGRALANAAADMYMRERDEAQAELAALKARAQWQPIETAPHDGNRVLLWNRDWAAPFAGQFYGEAAGGWRLDYRIAPFTHQPTHWMPPPPAPSVEE